MEYKAYSCKNCGAGEFKEINIGIKCTYCGTVYFNGVEVKQKIKNDMDFKYLCEIGISAGKLLPYFGILKP